MTQGAPGTASFFSSLLGDVVVKDAGIDPLGTLGDDANKFNQIITADVFGTKVVLTIKGDEWTFTKNGFDVVRKWSELKTKAISGGAASGNIGGEVSTKGWEGKLGQDLVENVIQGYVVDIFEKGIIYYDGSHPTGDQCVYKLFEKPVSLK
jgi:hypothetical protein